MCVFSGETDFLAVKTIELRCKKQLGLNRLVVPSSDSGLYFSGNSTFEWKLTLFACFTGSMTK